MWDIHGNPLKKGYCEVHPHVAEEYPCHICLEQQQVAYIHQKASEIVDYEATLEEKLHRVRSMAGLTADQYTVNLLGHIHEDVERLIAERDALLMKVQNQKEQLQSQQAAITKIKALKRKAESVSAHRRETIKGLRRTIKFLQRKKVK